VAQPGLVPTLAVFASRSAISTPPRFAINYSVRATLAVFAGTHRLRTSDVEREQEVSRKPCLRCYTGITYSIKPAGQNKSFAPAHSGIRPVHRVALGAGSELVVLVFEQDVERGERSVTARDILLQVELVRIAQFVARVHLLLENSQIIPRNMPNIAAPNTSPNTITPIKMSLIRLSLARTPRPSAKTRSSR